tara:strand:- start:79 stop:2226 length:2148 start_codon:yes stop_codon:yes gene_type:complete
MWAPRFLKGTEKLEIQPDMFSIEDLTKSPPDSFVISRKLTGDVLSIYGDNVWDLSPYSTISKGIKYNFTSQFGSADDELSLTAHTIIGEMKHIMFAALYEPTHSGGQRNKPQTYIKMIALLRGLSIIALNENKTLAQLHESPFAVPKITASLYASRTAFRKAETLRDLKALIDYLNERFNAGLPSLIPNEQVKKIISAGSQLRSNYINDPSAQRTPLIPSRIYAALINLSTEMVNDFHEHKENIKGLLNRINTDPLFFATPSMLKENAKPGTVNNAKIYQVFAYYRTKYPNAKRTEMPLVSQEDSIAEYNLTEFFERWSIGSIYKNIGYIKYTLKGIRGYLCHVLDAARILIYSYSGMRKHEMDALQQNCLSRIQIPGLGELPIVLGHTSKMTNSNYSESALPWATCSQAIPAVEACCFIRDMMGCLTDFLFPSFDHPMRIRKFLDTDVHRQKALSYISRGSDELRVRESDIVELENFDAFRDWRNDPRLNLKVGEYFHLENHQFRRSTAVYAARSGMVSLPSLKFQFKHLSEVMTMLYRENASFAENIFNIVKTGSSHDVIRDYRDELMFLEALDFEAHVVKSTDELFGGAGSRFEQEKTQSPSWFNSIEDIEIRVKDGRISYRETVLGGCSSREMCDKFNVDEVIPCLAGCNDAILGGDDGLGLERGHKLKKYKSTLEAELVHIDPKHPSARLAHEEITLINQKLIKIEAINE